MRSAGPFDFKSQWFVWGATMLVLGVVLAMVALTSQPARWARSLVAVDALPTTTMSSEDFDSTGPWWVVELAADGRLREREISSAASVSVQPEIPDHPYTKLDTALRPFEEWADGSAAAATHSVRLSVEAGATWPVVRRVVRRVRARNGWVVVRARPTRANFWMWPIERVVSVRVLGRVAVEPVHARTDGWLIRGVVVAPSDLEATFRGRDSMAPPLALRPAASTTWQSIVDFLDVAHDWCVPVVLDP